MTVDPSDFIEVDHEEETIPLDEINLSELGVDENDAD